MNTDKWNNISALFEHALTLPPAARDAYLATLAGTQSAAVVREVKALLQADEDSAGFLQTSALRLAARELAQSTMPIQADTRYGNYRILEKLGAGGMGEVFLAHDETLDRQAALKFLPHVFMQDAAQRARFEHEARAASALNHPNILTVYEIGAAHGRVFIATEYVAGQTLRDKINERSLTTDEIFGIAAQVCEALHAAHTAGLVHRDIKPENLMVRPDGYVKLLDFGLAQAADVEPAWQFAATGSDAPFTPLTPILGTPRYLSPEQAHGAPLDGRSDLWSLGVTLCEMLTGQTPYANDEVLTALRDARPVAVPSVPPRWQPILQKALAKPLAERYQSAPQLLADLRQARQPKPARHALRWLLAAAAIVLLVFGAGPWLRRTPPPPVEKLYWEMTDAEQQAFVTDAALRVAQGLGANAAPLTPAQVALIRPHLAAYVARRNSLATEPGRESMKAVYARATVYAPFIIEEFRARGLSPLLGLYVALNETDYHPCTASAVGAKGLFSFMPQTAVRYGLRLTPQDERCNPRGIANAAARYLDDLRRMFGSDAGTLTLVLAAYNCGEHCIGERVDELRKRNLPARAVWDLLALTDRPLGEETKNYVPRFLAGAVIGEHPQRFGLEIKPLSTYATAR